MKILFVTPSVSRLFTGVYEVEKNLTLEFYKKNYTVEVHGLIDDYTQQDLHNWLPVKPILYKPFGFIKLGYNPTYFKNLNLSNADIGHIHSLWSYTTFALYKWSKLNKKPYILSVNAYLFDSALSQSKVIKKIAFAIGIYKVIMSAACIHVNTLNEYNAVRKLGFKNPIAIIANGVLLPNLNNIYTNLPWQNYPTTKNKKILLYLSRIHQQKGIDLLIEAWNQISISNSLKDWHLVIVGFQKNKSTFENKIVDIISKNKLNNTVTILPGQFEESMESCYSNCTGFILPSYNEGSSIAALNALAFSKPALITKGCNITKVFENKSAIEIETNINSIKSGILSLIDMKDIDRENLGKKGRDLVENNYTWEIASTKILEIYNWVIDPQKNPIPKTVVSD